MNINTKFPGFKNYFYENKSYIVINYKENK